MRYAPVQISTVAGRVAAALGYAATPVETGGFIPLGITLAGQLVIL